MSRSDADPKTADRRLVDWRGWIILAWVVWFGILYGKMVVEQRGDRFREWVARIGKSDLSHR
jgi:hypothetical protein